MTIEELSNLTSILVFQRITSPTKITYNKRISITVLINLLWKTDEAMLCFVTLYTLIIVRNKKWTFKPFESREYFLIGLLNLYHM